MFLKQNGKWISIFLLLILLCLGALLLHNRLSADTHAAQILQNGQVIRTIDLRNVAEPYELQIKANNGGFNTIRVENGKIGIIHASCPDQVCVRQGFISDGTLPIVCLPNELTVVIKDSEKELDAVVGGA